MMMMMTAMATGTTIEAPVAIPIALRPTGILINFEPSFGKDGDEVARVELTVQIRIADPGASHIGHPDLTVGGVQHPVTVQIERQIARCTSNLG